MAICQQFTRRERWRDGGKINKYSHVKSFDGNTKIPTAARAWDRGIGEREN
jgi:hypothetical protein